MMFALLGAMAQGVWAESIKYIDRTWDEATKKVVETEVTAENAVNLADIIADQSNYRETYYTEEPLVPQTLGENVDYGVNIGDRTVYITGEMDLSHYTLYAYGRTKLIICDGAEAKIHHIIIEINGLKGELHIYGQQNETGKLVVNEARTTNGRVEFSPGISKRLGDVGIGGSGQFGGAQTYIHSGKVTAYGSERGPGIGNQVGPDEGLVYIYGGTVVAEGSGDRAEGIGGANDIRIYGGNVTARGGDEGAGIGGEWDRKVKIFGGTVHAYGGMDAAGIGGNKSYTVSGRPLLFEAYGGADVDISGGTVYAEGKGNGAGIGTGRSGTDYGYFGCRVNISGGDVTARGGKYAAGIGSGINNHVGDITISGGTVHAYGGVDAAGIGGGEDGDSGDITISGGTVYAESTGDNSNAVGIGAGEDGKGINIKITGGTVTAKGGGGSANAIGSNLSEESKGSLSISDTYYVEAGGSENNIERRFTSLERKNACWYRKYVKIEECNHTTPTEGSDKTEAISYTIAEEGHDFQCRYCNYSGHENHVFASETADEPCQKCGKKFNAADDMCTITIYQANTTNTDLATTGDYDGGTQYSVVKGKSFNMPALTKTANGLSMMALVKDPQTAPTNIWLTDAEKTNHTNFFDPSQPFTPTQDTKIYARYRLDYTTRWVWNEDEYGFIDPSKVEMWFSNPLLYDGNEQQLPIAIDVQENRWDDDITYTATVTYPYQYPEGLTGVTYTFTDVKHTPYFSRNVTLKSNEKNNSTISDYAGKTVQATIEGMTFSHDGSWNTICLPFALSEEQLADEECPLHGAVIKQLEDASFANGTLTLTFSDNLTATEAGKTYIVKWEQGDNVTDPVFKNVTITDGSSASMPTIIAKDKDGKTTEDYENIYFGIVVWGSYNPTVITDDFGLTNQLLYMGADNTLYFPSEPMTIDAFRGFFHLYGITLTDLAQGDKSIMLNFGEETTTTGISTTNYTNFTNFNSDWYSLDGRRLNSKPTLKGVYIHDGKKVVIK